MKIIWIIALLRAQHINCASNVGVEIERFRGLCSLLSIWTCTNTIREQHRWSTNRVEDKYIASDWMRKEEICIIKNEIINARVPLSQRDGEKKALNHLIGALFSQHFGRVQEIASWALPFLTQQIFAWNEPDKVKMQDNGEGVGGVRKNQIYQVL